MREFSSRVIRHRQVPFRFLGLSEFETVKKVGSGGFSEVYEVVHTSSGVHYCLKQMDLAQLDSPNYINIENEIRIHSTLKHKNIVQLLDFFIEGTNLYIVLECCTNGNLFKYLNSYTVLPEHEVCRIFNEVCQAIAHLHSRRVMQRDIKPENILLTDRKESKLCDFGWAIEENSGDYCKAKAGTCAYMPPEALRGEMQTCKSDIWALGILLFELYHNIEPYEGSIVSKQMAVIQSTKLNFHPRVSQNARNLIVACLKQNPLERPDIQTLLRHEYFCEANSQQANRSKMQSRSTEPQKLQSHLFETKPQQPFLPAPLAAGQLPAPAPSGQDIIARLRAQNGIFAGRVTQTNEKPLNAVDASKRFAQPSYVKTEATPASNSFPLEGTTNSLAAISSGLHPQNIYSSIGTKPTPPPTAQNPLTLSMIFPPPGSSRKSNINPLKLSAPAQERPVYKHYSNPTSIEKIARPDSSSAFSTLRQEPTFLPIDQLTQKTEKANLNFIVYVKADHAGGQPVKPGHSLSAPEMNRSLREISSSHFIGNNQFDKPTFLSNSTNPFYGNIVGRNVTSDQAHVDQEEKDFSTHSKAVMDSREDEKFVNRASPASYHFETRTNLGFSALGSQPPDSNSQTFPFHHSVRDWYKANVVPQQGTSMSEIRSLPITKPTFSSAPTTAYGAPLHSYQSSSYSTSEEFRLNNVRGSTGATFSSSLIYEPSTKSAGYSTQKYDVRLSGFKNDKPLNLYSMEKFDGGLKPTIRQRSVEVNTNTLFISRI